MGVRCQKGPLPLWGWGGSDPIRGPRSQQPRAVEVHIGLLIFGRKVTLEPGLSETPSSGDSATTQAPAYGGERFEESPADLVLIDHPTQVQSQVHACVGLYPAVRKGQYEKIGSLLSPSYSLGLSWRSTEVPYGRHPNHFLPPSRSRAPRA